MRTVSGTIGGVIGELAGIVLPVQCPGCGAWDEVLCASCREIAHSVPAWSLLDSEEPTNLWPTEGGCATRVASLGSYDAALRRIIIAAKHSERFDASSFLEDAGRTLGEAISRRLHDEGEDGGVEQWWVIPAPASWKRRLVGRSVTDPLASGTASGLAAASGITALVVDAVRLKIGAASQAGRGGAARRRRRAGSMVSLMVPPVGAGVVLVDDVMTTGATMREAARVIGGCAAIAVAAHV